MLVKDLIMVFTVEYKLMNTADIVTVHATDCMFADKSIFYQKRLKKIELKNTFVPKM